MDVVLCECVARDGLQHEPDVPSTAEKVALIDLLTAAGFPRIEATSYSHPKRVPAFADASEVLAGITRREGVGYKATCPNQRAVERAIADAEAGHGATELSLLVSASEGHSRKNLNASRAEQWARVEEMAAAARGRFELVGVVSVAFGCPIDGPIDPGRVAEDVARFADLGAGLVTVGDTTGHSGPSAVKRLFARLEKIEGTRAVGHFHDTRGAGIVNALAALETGCGHLDSALGGAGGNPVGIDYGEGFTGNVATEDLVNVLEMEGLSTGLDLDAVMRASERVEALFGRQMYAKVPRSGWLLPRRAA